jgi:hypothetical protein
MDKVILGNFNRGVMDRIRKEIGDFPEYIQFVSDDEARVLCEGIFVFKNKLGRLYFYLQGFEFNSTCIATVRDKRDMIAAIEGFMATFRRRL